MLYVAAMEASKIWIYPSRGTQIIVDKPVQIPALKQDEAFSKILAKYYDFIDVFLFELAMKLPENISINKHAIKLKKDKQLFYELIYNPRLVKCKTLKT